MPVSAMIGGSTATKAGGGVEGWTGAAEIAGWAACAPDRIDMMMSRIVVQLTKQIFLFCVV